MQCHNCSQEGKSLCSLCHGRRYCGKECQAEDWETHRDECFDSNKLGKILIKLNEIGLIRHVNGDTLDNRRQNLQRVSVPDAFENKDWTVDAVCHLTDEEFEIWDRGRKVIPKLNRK